MHASPSERRYSLCACQSQEKEVWSLCMSVPIKGGMAYANVSLTEADVASVHVSRSEGGVACKTDSPHKGCVAFANVILSEGGVASMSVSPSE